MKHETIKAASLEEFRSKRKFGSSQISQTYEDKLVRKIKEAYESFVKCNESKHIILCAYPTRAVVAAALVASGTVVALYATRRSLYT